MLKSRAATLLLSLLVLLVMSGAATSAASAEELNWKANGQLLKAGEEKPYSVGETIIKIKDGPRTFECKGQTIKGQLKKGTVEVKVENFGTCQLVSPKKAEAKVKSKDLPWAGNLIQKSGKQAVEFPAVGLEIEVEGEANTTIEGSQEGEWNNTSETISFPETPLEGTTLKDGKEPVTWSGGYPVTLGGGEKLNIGKEMAGFFESNSGESKGNLKSGPYVLEGGGATLECSGVTGTWTILSGGIASTKGTNLQVAGEKWEGCFASSSLIKHVAASVGACTLEFAQDKSEVTASGAIVGVCKVEVKVLGTCTITLENQTGLRKNASEDNGASLFVFADDGGVRIKPNSACLGIKETKEANLKATFSGALLKAV